MWRHLCYTVTVITITKLFTYSSITDALLLSYRKLCRLFVSLHRETQAGVTPRGAVQTVHPGAPGHSAARPAQEPGRFQVAH